jgi:hypothetical protein
MIPTEKIVKARKRNLYFCNARNSHENVLDQVILVDGGLWIRAGRTIQKRVKDVAKEHQNVNFSLDRAGKA